VSVGTDVRAEVPAEVRARLDELLDGRPEDDTAFWGRQYDLGLAWVSFPVGSGGLGGEPGLQTTVDAAVETTGRTRPAVRNQIGIGLVAPTLVEHGAEPLRRLLRPCFTAEDVWCQLFSEPGAGSDLANVSTAARLDPSTGSWRVTGQKMWTSYARSARWGLLLARTDPGVPKHRGLTCFVVDMQDPGVEVLPIKQINGYARVNTVHLDDVPVPDDARVGAVGAGWATALSALAHERRMLGAKAGDADGGHARRALDLWRSHGRRPEHVDALVGLWVRSELVRLTAARAAHEASRGLAGAGAAVGKLLAAELERDAYDLVMDVLGPEGLGYPGYDGLLDADYRALEYADPRSAYLSSRRTTIAGGTSEIMRNVLSERALDLPPEPRVDKDVPWNQTLRG
jgi:alkylation response protein AidB-like acyl-CoA dehydrogenase